MVLSKEVPDIHIFSTRAGDVAVRPDLNCYLLLPIMPTSPRAELRPLHPSLCGGKHYFSSRWHDSIYVVMGNKFMEAQDLSIGSSGQARQLHPSCCGGQHYFAIAGGFVIILSQGTSTTVKDLATGEPVPGLDPGHQWSKEKVGSIRSYLYWDLWDNFSGSFFSFHPNILSFLPGGLGLAKGPAFGAWELLIVLHNYSDIPVTRSHGIFQKVGYAKEKLADIGYGWTASLPDSPEPGSVVMALARAQFALPSQYGGMGLNTEQEEWKEAREEEKTLELTLLPNEMAYVWQYQLGLGKDAILFCREIKVTSSSDPPYEPSLPPLS
ncbi:uncharacterized protein LOC129340473 [Eublepharis macularius]|uniref:Uncharacterized protein LOC129340473 n=1 Tax=Eublepharis macularius TaxID=481883 RepID=A0AA97LDF2_EUBMA|nr:uncharacterized protein LOC129340473 [Eublepharis macularius]